MKIFLIYLNLTIRLEMTENTFLNFKVKNHSKFMFIIYHLKLFPSSNLISSPIFLFVVHDVQWNRMFRMRPKYTPIRIKVITKDTAPAAIPILDNCFADLEFSLDDAISPLAYAALLCK